MPELLVTFTKLHVLFRSYRLPRVAVVAKPLYEWKSIPNHSCTLGLKHCLCAGRTSRLEIQGHVITSVKVSILTNYFFGTSSPTRGRSSIITAGIIFVSASGSNPLYALQSLHSVKVSSLEGQQQLRHFHIPNPPNRATAQVQALRLQSSYQSLLELR
jgi:hypothetical protein